MNFRHMYWKNGCKKTVERMKEENKAKALDPEIVKKINDRVGEMAEEDSRELLRFKEGLELKDWQWEIVLENESKNEG